MPGRICIPVPPLREGKWNNDLSHGPLNKLEQTAFNLQETNVLEIKNKKSVSEYEIRLGLSRCQNWGLDHLPNNKNISFKKIYIWNCSNNAKRTYAIARRITHLVKMVKIDISLEQIMQKYNGTYHMAEVHTICWQ